MAAATTQTQKVIKHLQEVGPLTTFQAFELYGIARLSARIHDARDMGYSIKTSSKTVKNRDGNHVTFAVYEMEA